MTRSSMTARLGLLAGLAAVVVLAVVLVAGAGGGNSHKGASPATIESGLKSIPQSGIALGSPKAPVTMVEFADLQCPFCGQYHRDVFPTLLKRYIRTGKLRVELHLLRFIGPDSDRLARAAAAASMQNRIWQFVSLAYARQGTENSGYANQQFINKLAADAGLKPTSAGAAAEQQVSKSERIAKTLGISSTPSFLIGPTGGPFQRFEPSELTPGAFIPAIQQELKG